MLKKIEGALSKFWMDYGRAIQVKGAHTEVLIEPKFFISGQLNPEAAELLVSVYLSQVTPPDLAKGKVVIADGALKINDKYGQCVAEVHSPKIIREFASRLGI
ncbi:MAG: hypothetical protein WC645_04935 [Candidatus Margulisiibacteriota bacterium]